MKKNHTNQKIIQLVAAILVFILMVATLSACSMKAGTSMEDETSFSIESYHDIPGITDEEIAAIENLKSQRQEFIYSATNSTEAFILPDGTYRGFTPAFCELLSDLFGISFTIRFHTWGEVMTGLDDMSLDFSNDLTPTPERRERFFMTKAIAERTLSIFLKDHSLGIESTMDLRGLTIGFFEGSITEKSINDFYPNLGYIGVTISDVQEAVQKLLRGEIDAVITDSTVAKDFADHMPIVSINAFPLVYTPVSMTTANPELAPIITVMDKYIVAGGIDVLYELYQKGEAEYAGYAFRQSLSEDERMYLEQLEVNGGKIPIALEHDNYPICFYNTQDEEYQGIAVDILMEISELIGIELDVKTNKNTIWSEIFESLKTCEVAIVSQLIYSDERADNFIWPDTPYFTSRFAFVSKVDTPNIRMYQVVRSKVGITDDTAYEEMYKEWFTDDSNVIYYDSHFDLFDALERDEIDLALVSEAVLLLITNYLEMPGYKANLIVPSPLEESYFGLNKNETVLRSIISKALPFINTTIVGNDWTSRVYDYSKQIAQERATYMTAAAFLLFLLLSIASILLMINNKKRKIISKQEKIVEETSNRLQTILDMLPIGVRIMSIDDGTLLYSNQSCLKVFNCTSFEEQVQGMNGFAFMPEYQPDGRKTADVAAEFFQSKEDVVIAEMQCLKLGGEPFICRITSRTMDYAGHRASLAAMEDVTAQEEYRRMLENTALKEQEANQLKSRFLAQMSHEIRTPMNAILGMSELAMRDESIDTVREHIYTINQAGLHLLAIINDILDFSKIEAGKMVITPGEYMIASLLNDVISIIKMRVVDSLIRFAVKVDSRIPHTLFGDEKRIRQAVLNLLNNAVKYTERGFVSFAVYCEFIDDSNMNLTFEITDSGIGIKQENIEKLFTDFAQFDLEKNRAIEGVGLGLAITKSIVDTMGGTISVTSEYGEGSTFSVTFPQKYSTCDPLAVVHNPREKSVIIYERRKKCAESLVYSVENLGVDCAHVESEAALIKKMESHEYQYLFVAYELFKRNENTIRRLAPNTKIVILAEFGEAIPEKNLSVVAMPLYCTFIADILNGIYGIFSYAAIGESVITFKAPDARVLVVDDINTNLKVTKGFLDPYKMRIDLRNGGMEAIKSLQSVQYDLIFMDHKMPGIDGVEATRRIRAMGESDPYYKEVPIVALTANAVSGMNEMFLENGFNDFLFKPIEAVKLNAILEKWIPANKKMSLDSIVDSYGNQSIEEDTLLNIDGLDVRKGMASADGSMRLYIEALTAFYTDMDAKISIMGDCLETGDLSLYCTYLNAFKKEAFKIGAVSLSKAAEALEMAGEKENIAFIKENHNYFISNVRTLLQNIKSKIYLERHRN